MRLEPSKPTNESNFFAGIRKATLGQLFLERVEPANESGFPDVYYTFRDGSGEGTIELKHAKTQEPNLSSLFRGNQKAALLEYYEGGGRRRFTLCYCNGRVYLWDTKFTRDALLSKKPNGWKLMIGSDTERFSEWLTEELRQA